MYIHRTQSAPPELTPIHQRPHFLMRQDRESPEALKEGQDPVALLDRTEREFLNHAAMTSDLIVTQECNE